MAPMLSALWTLPRMSLGLHEKAGQRCLITMGEFSLSRWWRRTWRATL